MDSLVSIIVRTKGRPEALRRALLSLSKQTMRNFEVVIIEDDNPYSESVINDSSFTSMNIRYYSTNKSVGRSRAANLGLEKCKGSYINFLDDDDYFYPNHIEILYGSLKSNNSNKIKFAYAGSIERKHQTSDIPPIGKFFKGDIIKLERINDKTSLFYKNPFPIQSVMFTRELYDKYGGIDENLMLLEDWDLWIKYSLYADILFLDNITSVYHVPNSKSELKRRYYTHKNYEQYIFKKYEEKWIELDIKRPTLYQKMRNKINQGINRTFFSELLEKITIKF